MSELRLLIYRLVISKSAKVASSKSEDDGTVRKYGTPEFLRRSTVRGTVRFFCNGTRTVRWYGTLQKLN